MTRELSQRLYSEAITTRCNDRSRALLGIVLFSQHGLTVAIHLGYIWRGGYTLRRHISWFSCIVKKNFIAFLSLQRPPARFLPILRETRNML